jgi:hypothetical protein
MLDTFRAMLLSHLKEIRSIPPMWQWNPWGHVIRSPGAGHIGESKLVFIFAYMYAYMLITSDNTQWNLDA